MPSVFNSQLPPSWTTTLGLPAHSPPEVIRAQYKRLALKYHPDKNPTELRQWATQKMSELSLAYERAMKCAGAAVGASGEGANSADTPPATASGTGIFSTASHPLFASLGGERAKQTNLKPTLNQGRNKQKKRTGNGSTTGGKAKSRSKKGEKPVAKTEPKSAAKLKQERKTATTRTTTITASSKKPNQEKTAAATRSHRTTKKPERFGYPDNDIVEQLKTQEAKTTTTTAAAAAGRGGAISRTSIDLDLFSMGVTNISNPGYDGSGNGSAANHSEKNDSCSGGGGGGGGPSAGNVSAQPIEISDNEGH